MLCDRGEEETHGHNAQGHTGNCVSEEGRSKEGEDGTGIRGENKWSEEGLF